MPKPAKDWTEDDVLALPAGENDSLERKGSKLLDLTIPGVKEDEVLNELAKQLSAFSNAGGGQIIYGVADDCTVENGGIASSVKGRQSTKEWLEDVDSETDGIRNPRFQRVRDWVETRYFQHRRWKGTFCCRMYLIATGLRISLRET